MILSFFIFSYSSYSLSVSPISVDQTSTLADNFGISNLPKVNRISILSLKSSQNNFENSIEIDSDTTINAVNTAALSDLLPPAGDSNGLYYYQLKGATNLQFESISSSSNSLDINVCTLIYFYPNENAEIPAIIINANTKNTMYEGYDFVKSWNWIKDLFKKIFRKDISDSETVVRYWNMTENKSYNFDWYLNNTDNEKTIVLTQAFVNLFPYIEIRTLSETDIKSVFNKLTGSIALDTAGLTAKILYLAGDKASYGIVGDVVKTGTKVWDKICSWFHWEKAKVKVPSTYTIICSIIGYVNDLNNWIVLSPYSSIRQSTHSVLWTELIGIMLNGLYTSFATVNNDVSYGPTLADNVEAMISNHDFENIEAFISTLKNYYMNGNFNEITNLSSQIQWTINCIYWIYADSGKTVTTDTTNIFKYINDIMNTIQDDTQAGEGITNILADTVFIAILLALDKNSDITENDLLYDLYNNGFRKLAVSFSKESTTGKELSTMDSIAKDIQSIDSTYALQALILEYILAFMNAPVTYNLDNITVEVLRVFLKKEPDFVSSSQSTIINILKLMASYYTNQSTSLNQIITEINNGTFTNTSTEDDTTDNSKQTINEGEL